MLNTTTFTTSFSGSIARFFGFQFGADSTSQMRKAMQAAYEEFAAKNGGGVDSLFDMQFLTQHGEATVAAYLNGALSRHQAAVELANAWEEHVMPANTKRRKVMRADAAMAADRYLSYLPA